MNTASRRKKNRLAGDLYRRPGTYFITICTRDRKRLFWSGSCAEDDHCLPLSETGRFAEEQIVQVIGGYAPMLRADKFVVMPNHVHMLLSMEAIPERDCPDIRYVIRYYKRLVSQYINDSIWQKGFYDHIVRNEDEYRQIWKYIDENPIKWRLDRYYIEDIPTQE